MSVTKSMFCMSHNPGERKGSTVSLQGFPELHWAFSRSLWLMFQNYLSYILVISQALRDWYLLYFSCLILDADYCLSLCALARNKHHQRQPEFKLDTSILFSALITILVDIITNNINWTCIDWNASKEFFVLDETALNWSLFIGIPIPW